MYNRMKFDTSLFMHIILLHLLALPTLIIRVKEINAFSVISIYPKHAIKSVTNKKNQHNNSNKIRLQNLVNGENPLLDTLLNTIDDVTHDDSNNTYDLWERTIKQIGNPYRSVGLFQSASEQDNADNKSNNNDKVWNDFLKWTKERTRVESKFVDPFWEQIVLEAQAALQLESQAGPQLYQGILSQPDLLTAVATIIAHEIASPLVPATAIKSLFLDLLTVDDVRSMRCDLQAVSTRSPSVGNAMDAVLFHNGFHALVCYRVAHRLWLSGRTGLAYFLQSTISRTYSADIHPACQLGCSLYVRVGAGVVIGETAVVGNDVSILEGVTLGGTGKESGNRHPKIHNGVIIYDGGTVLGNIIIGEGSVITAKSIVTKPTPPLAIVSGVPARIQGYRQLHDPIYTNKMLNDPLQEHLIDKYCNEWATITTE